MVTNDATLVRLKHKIMEETAKLAWEGKSHGDIPLLCIQRERTC